MEAYAPSFVEKRQFCGLCKKILKNIMYKAIFNTKFCIFYTLEKQYFLWNDFVGT
jgi:hypothetical protein